MENEVVTDQVSSVVPPRELTPQLTPVINQAPPLASTPSSSSDNSKIGFILFLIGLLVALGALIIHLRFYQPVTPNNDLNSAAVISPLPVTN